MLLLWIIYVISVLFLICFRARLFINAWWSPAGKGLTSWLSFVMSNCEVVTFLLVSWVRCDAWLYQFLIFALFLTFKPHWSWSDSSKEQSNLGTHHYRTVTLKGALRYVFIGKISFALYIYGPLHRPYLSIPTTAESCHANMTLANRTDPNEM